MGVICIPLLFGTAQAHFLQVGPRCLVKSTAVVELPEGAIQNFATALQLIQNADLVLLGRLHLVNCVFFCSKQQVAFGRLLPTKARESPNVSYNSARRSSAATVFDSNRTLHCSLRNSSCMWSSRCFFCCREPLSCPQIHFCDIHQRLPGPVSSFISFLFLFLFFISFLFLSLLSFLFFPCPRSTVLVLVLCNDVRSVHPFFFTTFDAFPSPWIGFFVVFSKGVSRPNRPHCVVDPHLGPTIPASDSGHSRWYFLSSSVWSGH